LQAEDGPQREENAVTLPLRAVTMGIVLTFSALGQASAQAPPAPTGVRHAFHWCLANRPCNWSSHATIAGGIVWGLSRVEVKPELAALAAALVFVGKEVRDDRKWGNVLGSTDSMGDLLSGVAGAYVGYRLFGHTRNQGLPPVMVNMNAEDGASFAFRIRTGGGEAN
jgi:hypothetical protein